MSLPDTVNTLQGRIETFQVSHALTKRRASSTKKKTPTNLTWPHTSPLPEQVRMLVPNLYNLFMCTFADFVFCSTARTRRILLQAKQQQPG